MRNFYKDILQLVLSPDKAWEDIGNEGVDNYSLEHKGLYPLMAVAALSAFAQPLYHSSVTLLDAGVRGAGIFVSLFAGFLIAGKLFAAFSERYANPEADMERAQAVATLGLSLMALSSIVCNLMPVSLGLPFLLPLYSALVIWRSFAYLGVPKDMALGYLVFVMASIAAPPMLIQAVFDFAVNS